MTNKALPSANGAAMGLLVGIGIGAAAGLLLAPRKGEETRALIRQRAMEARDRLRHQVSDTVGKAQETADKAARRAASAAGDERPR